MTAIGTHAKAREQWAWPWSTIVLRQQATRIAALEAALKEIVSYDHLPGCDATSVPADECGCRDGRTWHQIARAALVED